MQAGQLLALLPGLLLLSRPAIVAAQVCTAAQQIFVRFTEETKTSKNFISQIYIFRNLIYYCIKWHHKTQVEKDMPKSCLLSNSLVISQVWCSACF